jgi:hypothetical protein
MRVYKDIFYLKFSLKTHKNGLLLRLQHGRTYLVVLIHHRFFSHQTQGVAKNQC